MKIKQTETSIQKGILDYLAAKKLLTFRLNTKGEVRRGGNGKLFLTKNENRGFADILCLHNGLAIFLEVKTEIGKLSDDQIAFANRVVEAGCSYFVVRSKQDVKSCLETIGIKI